MILARTDEHPDYYEPCRDICEECNEDPCVCTYCPDCKGVNTCSCDEQFEADSRRLRYYVRTDGNQRLFNDCVSAVHQLE